jgi:hypothetical protein
MGDATAERQIDSSSSSHGVCYEVPLDGIDHQSRLQNRLAITSTSCLPNARPTLRAENGFVKEILWEVRQLDSERPSMVLGYELVP